MKKDKEISKKGESAESEPVKLDKFFADSSIPGFSRFTTFTTPSARAVWCFVLVASFIGFVAHTAVLLYRFSQRATMTSTVLNDVEFVFPDVTVCNNFPLNKPRSKAPGSLDLSLWAVNSSPTDSAKAGNVTGDYLLHQVKNFWKASYYDDPETPFDTELNKYTRADNPVTRRTLLHYVRMMDWYHHFEELILDCKYLGKPCHGAKDYEHQFYPIYGNCWTFRSQQQSSLEAGVENGLSLTLHVANRRALLNDPEILDWLRGAVVTIHEPGTLGLPGKGVSVIAAVGKHTYLGLEMTKSTRLNRSGRPCIDSGPVEFGKPSPVQQSDPDRSINIVKVRQDGRGLMKDSFRYNTGACKELTKQSIFLENCGCLSESHLLSAYMADKIIQDGLTHDGEKPNITSGSLTEYARLSSRYCHFVPPDYLIGPLYHQETNGTRIQILNNIVDITQGLLHTNFKNQTVMIQGKPVDMNTFKSPSSENPESIVNFSVWNAFEISRIKGQAECHAKIMEQMQAVDNLSGETSSLQSKMQHCSPSCDALSYEASITAYDWPMSVANARPALKQIISRRITEMKTDAESSYKLTLKNKMDKLSDIRDSFLKVVIYPENTLGTRIQEMYEYPFSGFFSDFGGVLGLWLGMSIITFIEIFGTCCSFFRTNKDDDEGLTKLEPGKSSGYLVVPREDQQSRKGSLNSRDFKDNRLSHRLPVDDPGTKL